MPDAELLKTASQGTLRTPVVFEKQLKRLLTDSRSEALSTRFASQWLRLQDVEKVRPDHHFYSYWDTTLSQAMVRETELFVDSLIREDRPVTDLLTADHTFVNERLAKHYGIPNILGDQYRRVTIADVNRRGVLGQGSVLLLTSIADRTSPVLRGKWVMEVLLGSPPPPPPPNVPLLEETKAIEDGKTLSTRERMEMHRKNPACNSCHRVIDPLGLALENYDVTGVWRIKDNGAVVDPVGDLYDGTKLDGPIALRNALLKHQDVFMLSFTESLMTYALGRRVESYDMPAVRQIVRDAKAKNYRFSAFISGVANSAAFRMGRVAPVETRGSGRLACRGQREPQMFITRKHISRRTVLRGMGVTMALPMIEAMVPARTVFARTAAGKVRLAAIEMVHGSAGATKFGLQKNLWSPAAVGKGFDLSVTALSPLEPFRDYLTIVSNTDVRNAEAFELPEIGGDHFRSSAVFLTQSHPRQTQGSDVRAGVSLDQVYAQKFGQDTPIPSMQLCIEAVDQAGGCSYGYSCVYTDTISWADKDQPLPMIRDPRLAFDQLFGVGATPEERAERRAEDKSILDLISAQLNRLNREIGAADRVRIANYLDEVREIERRIQKVEAYNKSGEPREIPMAPVGVPDSFDEHVKLMFDLQALAFASDTTRVFSFKMGRDASSRVYPNSGVTTGFHPASHHGDREDRILDFAKINRYHVGMLPYFLKKLKDTPDGESNLLDNTLVVYGSPMGDSNIHNHKRCPLFFAGKAGGALKGGLHIKAAEGTPMANAMLAALQGVGVSDMTAFGDSTSAMDLSAVQAATAAE